MCRSTVQVAEQFKDDCRVYGCGRGHDCDSTSDCANGLRCHKGKCSSYNPFSRRNLDRERREDDEEKDGVFKVGDKVYDSREDAERAARRALEHDQDHDHYHRRRRRYRRYDDEPRWWNPFTW